MLTILSRFIYIEMRKKDAQSLAEHSCHISFLPTKPASSCAFFLMLLFTKIKIWASISNTALFDEVCCLHFMPPSYFFLSARYFLYSCSFSSLALALRRLSRRFFSFFSSRILASSA